MKTMAPGKKFLYLALIGPFVLAPIPALCWSTGIGIIDNNVPQVLKDPGVVLKDPIGAVSDLAAKTGCYRCDVVIDKALPPEKRVIANAVITTGFVTAPLGPIGTLITLGVLVAPGPNQEAHGRDVPVPTKATPSSANHYSINVDCIVQRPNKRIEAYSIAAINGIESFRPGDTIMLTASKVCTEYNVGDTSSVTSATVVFGGAAVDPTAVTGKEFKYYIIGSA
jgi:hypothetical protein